MKQIVCAVWLTYSTCAMAQEPSDEAKKAALLYAYHMNGDSMVKVGSIDLTKCYHDGIFDCPKAVKTEKVAPTTNDFADRILVPPPEPTKRHGIKR